MQTEMQKNWIQKNVENNIKMYQEAIDLGFVYAHSKLGKYCLSSSWSSENFDVLNGYEPDDEYVDDEEKEEKEEKKVSASYWRGKAIGYFMVGAKEGDFRCFGYLGNLSILEGDADEANEKWEHFFRYFTTVREEFDWQGDREELDILFSDTMEMIEEGILLLVMKDLDVPALRQAQDVRDLIYWKAENEIYAMEELPDDDVGLKSGWLNREITKLEKLKSYFVTFDRSKVSGKNVAPGQVVTNTRAVQRSLL